MPEQPAPMTDPTAAQLAALREQMLALTQSVSRVEGKVDGVVVLDKALATMQADQRHSAGEIAELWKRVDAASDAILTVRDDTRQWIATARGAAWAFGVCWLLAQGMVFGLGAWAFNSIHELKQHTAVLESRMKSEEARGAPSTQTAK